MFKMIKNYEDRDQSHDLRFHMIISFIIKIMHDHMLSYCEALHTDILIVAHHAKMIVRMNDQIRKIIILFNKKHVSSVIFLNDLLK